MRPPESRESAATCCATFAAIVAKSVRYEAIETPIAAPTYTPRSGRAISRAGPACRPTGGERPVGPREIEVLGDRSGLAGVGQQLRQRRCMLGRAQRSVSEIVGSGARDDLRRGRTRVEVCEQELGGLAEARERELVVRCGNGGEASWRSEAAHCEPGAGGGEEKATTVHGFDVLR